MSTVLHKIIQAHIQAQFPGCQVVCATNPNEEWVALVTNMNGAGDETGAAYLAPVDGDSESLTFLLSPACDDEDRYPVSFDVTPTSEEWEAIIADREDQFLTALAAQPQKETMASDAWQLLEVAAGDLAENMIEHFKMSAEIETITAPEILDLIVRYNNETDHGE